MAIEVAPSLFYSLRILAMPDAGDLVRAASRVSGENPHSLRWYSSAEMTL